MPGPMLEISVKKRLGAFALDVELTCETSGIIAVFGRSGAGKTTLINLLAGLIKPDSGRIALNGETLFDGASGRNLPPERRRLGYVSRTSSRPQSKTITCRAASPLRIRSKASFTSSSLMREEIISSSSSRPFR